MTPSPVTPHSPATPHSPVSFRGGGNSSSGGGGENSSSGGIQLRGEFIFEGNSSSRGKSSSGGIRLRIFRRVAGRFGIRLRLQAQKCYPPCQHNEKIILPPKTWWFPFHFPVNPQARGGLKKDHTPMELATTVEIGPTCRGFCSRQTCLPKLPPSANDSGTYLGNGKPPETIPFRKPKANMRHLTVSRNRGRPKSGWFAGGFL